MSQYHVPHCPVCQSNRARYACTIGEVRAVRCSDCEFLYTNPQPSDETLQQIYGNDYFCGSDDPALGEQVEILKRNTARLYLEQLKDYGIRPGRILEIGCGDGYFLSEAEKQGWQVTGVEYSPHAVAKAQARLQTGKVFVGEIGQVELPEDHFDVCIMADVIEHVRDPRKTMRLVWKHLRTGGAFLVATPSRDSWSAKLMGSNWMEFKPEHLSYFDRRSLQSLLWQTGFERVRFEPGKKSVSLAYVDAHFRRYPSQGWSGLMSLTGKLLPEALYRRPLLINGSGMVSLAIKGTFRTTPLLSIIIPVYNEKSTVAELLDSVLAKSFEGIDREIIIVESNSTDGSREIVRGYEGKPGVRILWEQGPRGKGAATRLGIEAASGDVVLIQDADLEYDLEDYECLIEPVLQGRNAFVLGARHGGGFWKMRQFRGAYGTSTVMNAAHWVFTTLINIAFGLRLKDPFTMFKVFRRDAIAGIEFRCDRFDFDWELLIQLVRKGFRPIEIPVNYRSRSYDEGKKVRFFYDPITWMATLVRLRFSARPAQPKAQ